MPQAGEANQNWPSGLHLGCKGLAEPVTALLYLMLLLHSSISAVSNHPADGWLFLALRLCPDKQVWPYLQATKVLPV